MLDYRGFGVGLFFDFIIVPFTINNLILKLNTSKQVFEEVRLYFF